MRLLKPNSLRGRSAIAFLLVALIIVGAAFYLWHRHNQQKLVAVANANDKIISESIKSNKPDDKRTVLSAYVAEDNYEAAAPIARALAAQTKTYQDYLAALSICGLHDVSNQQDCITEVIDGAKPQISSIPFQGAYTAGAILEKNNFKKDAKVFYQRAYDIYAPDPNAQNMMTKDQLKAHIDAL
jgi:hypothetical protein